MKKRMNCIDENVKFISRREKMITGEKVKKKDEEEYD